MYAAHITLNISILHLPSLLRVYKVYALFLVVMFHFHNFANVIKLLIFMNMKKMITAIMLMMSMMSFANGEQNFVGGQLELESLNHQQLLATNYRHFILPIRE